MDIAYLNGDFLPLQDARVSVLDRGFLFADGVYELIPVYGRKLFRLQHHLNRLDMSLAGIKMNNPHSGVEWKSILNQLVERNEGVDQSLYLQITRGCFENRNHLIPCAIKPTIFAMSTQLQGVEEKVLVKGAKLITLEDIRWRFRNYKTIALLPNVLLRFEADEQGADEAILIEKNLATECTTSNFFIVEDGVLYTPPKSCFLLPGITRDLIIELAEKNGMNCKEEEIVKERLFSADELWITNSSKEILPVTRLDGEVIGDGSPGPVWRKMLGYFQEYKDLLRVGQAE